MTLLVGSAAILLLLSIFFSLLRIEHPPEPLLVTRMVRRLRSARDPAR